MADRAQRRSSVAQAGWFVVAFLVLAPLAFFALFREREPAAPPAAVEMPRTSLTAAGLKENVDWQGLPEIFAVWAERAHWSEGRTRFAWWHPGVRDYAYFFEARRTPAGIRFREIPAPSDPGFEWDPQVAADSPLRLYLPKRPTR